MQSLISSKADITLMEFCAIIAPMTFSDPMSSLAARGPQFPTVVNYN